MTNLSKAFDNGQGDFSILQVTLILHKLEIHQGTVVYMIRCINPGLIHASSNHQRRSHTAHMYHVPIPFSSLSIKSIPSRLYFLHMNKKGRQQMDIRGFT